MYCPPRPKPLSPIAALIRCVLQGEGDLLSLLPKAAYRMPIGPLGYSRRGIVIVNDPEMVRAITTDPLDIFPKNDLMVGALAPLVGESLFVSSGESWRRQRRMVDPAFTMMRISKAYGAMLAAVDEYETRLDAAAEAGEAISLDLAMSHLTADIICRTVFGTSLKSQTALEVFEAFSRFERSVAHVDYKSLIFDRPWSPVRQRAEVLAACALIRARLGELLDSHMAARGGDPAAYNDIASAIIGARDPESGEAFSREELIDQLGVFFLAGHETTASALTWAFFILGTQQEPAERLRREVEAALGDGPIGFEQVKRLNFTQNVFRETMRLYPPITFIPRVAAEATEIGGRRIKKGTMIMLAPWILHRHEAHWINPHAFDPDRFPLEKTADSRGQGVYMPFGQGPRTCVGAGFAMVEATLILARLMRRYEFQVMAPDKVRPVARLTTRPARQVMVRVRRRKA